MASTARPIPPLPFAPVPTFETKRPPSRPAASVGSGPAGPEPIGAPEPPPDPASAPGFDWESMLGVRGSALATAVAFTTGATIGVVLLARGRLRVQVGMRDLRLDRALLLRIARIGAPTGIEMFAMQMGFLVYLVFASRYGTEGEAVALLAASDPDLARPLVAGLP